MVRLAGLLTFALVLPLVPAAPLDPATPVSDGPAYTADGQLRFPAKYREWVFLSSALDMSYDPKAKADGTHSFNNVFVNPEAYRAYQASGHWPDGTMLVLESRVGESGAQASKTLNKAGQTQTDKLTGLEVHVLDSGHVKGDGWAFYGFENPVSAKVIARPATCYACHEQHAAVDTTFVQFYPTLKAAAEKHSSFSAAYLKEMQ